MKKNKLQLNKVNIATLTQSFEELKNTQNIMGGHMYYEDYELPKLTEQQSCQSDCMSKCAHCCDNV